MFAHDEFKGDINEAGPTLQPEELKIEDALSTVLLVIDVQNGFLPGGAIPIENGNDVIPIINRLRDTYTWKMIAFSQDWHCAQHISFLPQHPGTTGPVSLTYRVSHEDDPVVELCNTTGSGTFAPVYSCDFEDTKYNYSKFEQALWPPHCVVDTFGAKLASDIHYDPGSDIVIKKGTECNIDSYSAFKDNGGLHHTALQDLLSTSNIKNVFVTGLTLDYCVKYTALDSKAYGYNTYVILDATKPTSVQGGQQAIDELKRNGVHVITSQDMPLLGLKLQPSHNFTWILAVPLLIMSAGLILGIVMLLLKPKPTSSPFDGVEYIH